MTIEESIYDRLANDNSVTVFVDDRIYPARTPDDETPLPWVHYQITGAERIDSHLDGSGQLVKFTVELDILSNTYTETRSVHNAVVASLDHYRGGQILMSVWDSTSFGEVAEGYAASLVFEVVATEAAILPQSGGLPMVEVRADGLYFDGQKIGETGPAGQDGAPGYPTPLVDGQMLTNNGGVVAWNNNVNGLSLHDPTNVAVTWSIGVQGDATDNTLLLNDNDGNYPLQIKNGRVGLNTAATSGDPEATLHVYSGDNGILVGGATGSSQLQVNTSGVGMVSNHPLILKTTNTERARLDSTGKLGINSTSPAAQLDVRPVTSSTVGQVIRGATSQTANLSVWQDSTGTDVARVKPNGDWAFVASSQENIVLSAGGGMTIASNGLSRQVRFNNSAGEAVDVALGRDNITTGCVRVTDGSQINYGGIYVGSGKGVGFRSNTSVNYNKDQALVVAGWADFADATRKGNLTLQVYETTNAQTGLKLEAGASAAKIGFLGATPVSQQPGGAATASSTYGATEQDMLNKVYTAMRNVGLIG